MTQNHNTQYYTDFFKFSTSKQTPDTLNHQTKTPEPVTFSDIIAVILFFDVIKYFEE